ncbi:hypothetical protein V6000_009911 [Aspergillus fumigatus]
MQEHLQQAPSEDELRLIQDFGVKLSQFTIHIDLVIPEIINTLTPLVQETGTSMAFEHATHPSEGWPT